MSTIYIEYGIMHGPLGYDRKLYSANFASKSEASAYINERIAHERNPQIVHRRTTHKPGTGCVTNEDALTAWTYGTVQYCELGNQKCLSAVTVCVEARATGCTISETPPIYVCDEHTPTLADTIAHNEHQDTTLISFESRRLGTGEVIETYDAQKAESE